MVWTSEVTHRPAGASPTANHVVGVYADRIRPHLNGAVEAIIAAGAELAAAKAELPHGQFGPLLAELGLSQPMASRFMTVASRFENHSPVNALPPAVSVLVELARLDDDELEEAIKSGTVSPSTTRAEAQALTRPDRGEEASQPAPTQDREGADDREASVDEEPPVEKCPSQPDPADTPNVSAGSESLDSDGATDQPRTENSTAGQADEIDPQKIIEAIADDIYDDAEKCWDAVKKATRQLNRELFSRYPIELLAEALSIDDLDDLDVFADLVRERTEAIRSTKPTGLRVVQGGR